MVLLAERAGFETAHASGVPEQLRLTLEEPLKLYERHIYEPLLRDREAPEVAELTGQGVTVSQIRPDALNAGERKFVRDIVEFLDRPEFHGDGREYYLMRNVESLRSIGIYLEGETRVFYPDFVLWIVDAKRTETRIVFFDPKGQTGITDPTTLRENEKVRVATGGHLAELARELDRRHKRRFRVESFILLRESSPLGRRKGPVYSTEERALIADMKRRHVLRLDWHERNEAGHRDDRRVEGEGYLDMIFDVLS